MNKPHWREALEVVRASRAVTPQVVFGLASYYILTPLSAALDGVSWILLFRLMATDTGGLDAGPLSRAISGYAPAEPQALMRLVLVLFCLRTVLLIVLTAGEGWLQALVRRTIQEHCFSSILAGRWEVLRGQSVGQWMGTLTEEASIFSKYLMYFVKAAYSVLYCAILGVMAFLVSPKLTLLCVGVGVPCWLLLRLLYKHQMSLSSRQTQARQEFAADVNERAAGLFQIKASGDAAAHLKAGLRGQEQITLMEIALSWYNGLFTAFNPAAMTLGLAVIYFLQGPGSAPLSAQLATLGSVGVLGFRAASQLNNLVATLGNMTRLSGCIGPVHRLVHVPGEKPKAPIGEPLKGIALESAGYQVDGRDIIASATVTAQPGKLLLLSGPSGAGKTTLANLISGICEPTTGAVRYVGQSGKSYSAADHRPRIGYVTQDVHLFRGSVRVNLDPFGSRSDAELREALSAAGALSFVEQRGGLDAAVSEAGRAFSGGERRRLAIAAALAQRSDALILDEVTNGLDDSVKADLLGTIADLAAKNIVVAISHDLDAFRKLDCQVFPVGRA